ncbi:MAG: hypothetical protein N2508_04270, partial [Anaerolineae bacterium]|nr:hypothetical protein [Anaerolineae bacterium]
ACSPVLAASGANAEAFRLYGWATAMPSPIRQCRRPSGNAVAHPTMPSPIRQHTPACSRLFKM